MKEKVIEFLEETQVPAKTLGLDRMTGLMEKLGNPQDQLKIIHVAGTNGKGSVCAMLSSVLREAGYRVGLFTSPHLIEYNERIQINRKPINQKDFEELSLDMQKVCREISKEKERPIFFEVITAMAFTHFAKEKVDLVILETGIGGRYDATNIIKNPLLSIITSIGKDHMAFLGDTRESIAMEKGGIIKENCPTVLYDSDMLVYNVIKDICKVKKSPLFSCKESFVSKKKYNLQGSTFDVQNPHFTGKKNFTYKDMRLGLLGEHQISNALTALMAIEVLGLLGYSISTDQVYKGLENVKWAGRMEVVQNEPTVIIDGAHNEESAKAFIKSLANITKASKVYILIGVLKNKDYQSILKILLPFAHTIIVTQTKHDNALPANDLYKEITSMPRCPNLILEPDLVEAYKTGEKLVEKENILCCLGSLYLVGELKQFLNRR